MELPTTTVCKKLSSSLLAKVYRQTQSCFVLLEIIMKKLIALLIAAAIVTAAPAADKKAIDKKPAAEKKIKKHKKVEGTPVPTKPAKK